MTDKRLTNVLLAVVAVLLAVHLSDRQPAAEAQPYNVGPVQEPPVAIDGQVHLGSSAYQVFRFWSDGSVDRSIVTWGAGGCLPPTETCAIPMLNSCFGDTNWDGFVDVDDLTNIILEWGVCLDEGQ